VRVSGTGLAPSEGCPWTHENTSRKRYDSRVRFTAMPSALLLVACAGSHASPSAQVEPGSLAPPPPYLQPPPFVHLEPAPAEDEPRRTIGLEDRDLCARDLKAGAQRCRGLPCAEVRDCVEACFVDSTEARSAAAPLVVNVSSTPPVSASPRPPRPELSDPFAVALGDCLRRVREGGDEPVCRFLRPLDAMGFGQRHCDAKCAALTAEDRRHGARGGP
jgi:hypothetical protein